MNNDKQYATIAGIIQFPPQERTINGKDIREVMIRSIGKGVDVRVTIWDNYKAVPLTKGDAIIVDGEAKQNPTTNSKGEHVVYNNLSAITLVVIPQAPKVEQVGDAHHSLNRAVSAPDLDSIF